ncbi:MAG TPA: DNA-3-methyladenine glycosylase, partial [Gemmatimonadaceae bacterium]|nr:DNA-3-methyladenine glycosylase [Gemmatimonadaceae bacterium]
MSPASPHRKALAHLRSVDPVMGKVIDAVGRCTLAPRTEWTHFDSILRSIVYQQLSGKAASTIHGRVLTLIGDGAEAPRRIVATSHEAFRAAGLSNAKARYVRNLAEHVLDGSLPVESLHELSDEEIITALTQVKGIGKWSAQMFLMFRLGRPDVLPELDLGVQKGIQRAYRLRKLPTPAQVLRRGTKWAPYRTVAAWYMWRVLELPAG